MGFSSICYGYSGVRDGGEEGSGSRYGLKKGFVIFVDSYIGLHELCVDSDT